jgi:hypothetical protein
MPLALLDCSVGGAINLNEATAVSVRLSGSYVPTVDARQLQTRGDLQLNQGFRASGAVLLNGAHIGGEFDCTWCQFSDPNGEAIIANGLVVDGDMICDGSYVGRVSLAAAHIYIGESSNLATRFTTYRNPGPKQSTNIRMNERLLQMVWSRDKPSPGRGRLSLGVDARAPDMAQRTDAALRTIKKSL